MFLLRRPSRADIDRFLDRSRALPMSYSPVGILDGPPDGRRLGGRPFKGPSVIDQQDVVIGHGDADFQCARTALLTWKHFDLGWVEAFPDRPRIDAGTNVAVLIRHLGFWSLNGARVLDYTDQPDRQSAAFTYGTLTNHAESGEELFEVRIDPPSGDVIYKIRAISWAQSPLAWIGQPIVRLLQARFRKDSAAAMQRAAT